MTLEGRHVLGLQHHWLHCLCEAGADQVHKQRVLENEEPGCHIYRNIFFMSVCITISRISLHSTSHTSMDKHLAVISIEIPLTLFLKVYVYCMYLVVYQAGDPLAVRDGFMWVEVHYDGLGGATRESLA